MAHLRTMRLAHALPLAFGLAFAWPEPVDLDHVAVRELPPVAAKGASTPPISLASALPEKRRTEA